MPLLGDLVASVAFSNDLGAKPTVDQGGPSPRSRSPRGTLAFSRERRQNRSARWSPREEEPPAVASQAQRHSAGTGTGTAAVNLSGAQQVSPCR